MEEATKHSAGSKPAVNDGGAAFPTRTITHVQVDENYSAKAVYQDAPGMSLRDWFAGQALAGFACTANEELSMEDGETVDVALARHWSVCARAAYIVADAMLAAREARNA